MAESKPDGNSRGTLIALSSAGDGSIVNVYADPTTHRLLVDSTGGGGGGTVTDVSVVSANGFAGSVATSTTTPAITLSTTITGILSGNGTAISAASTTGSGAVVLQTSPSLVTPALGVATATSLAIAGATIGTDVLAWTGTATGSGALSVNNISLTGNTGSPVNGAELSTTNTLSFRTNSVSRLTINTAAISATVPITTSSGSGAEINTVAASATVPTLIPNRGSTTTGIGAQASGNLSAIVGGAEIVRTVTAGEIFQGGKNIVFTGSSSGTATLQVSATAGTGTVFQLPSDNGTNTYVLQTNGSGITSWVPAATGSGSVTSVASADGSITVTNPTTTVDLAAVKAPKWTTARNLAGNSVDGSANVAFANKFIVQGTTDAGLSGAQFLGALATGMVKNTTTTGVLSIGTAGTDYSAGTSALSTGILKSTTTTGALTIAVAADFPTLNQSTTGSAATLTTPRTIGTLTGDVTTAGSSFDGSANNTNATVLATVNSNVGSFTNASITVNGKGLITAASSGTGGITWTEVTGTSQTAAVNNGYILNNAGLVTVTLPTTAAVGSIVRVAGSGAGGWKVAQNASGIIHFNGTNTTTGTGGSIASTVRYDAAELVCIVANNEWVVISSVGNITVV